MEHLLTLPENAKFVVNDKKEYTVLHKVVLFEGDTLGACESSYLGEIEVLHQQFQCCDGGNNELHDFSIIIPTSVAMQCATTNKPVTINLYNDTHDQDLVYTFNVQPIMHDAYNKPCIIITENFIETDENNTIKYTWVFSDESSIKLSEQNCSITIDPFRTFGDVPAKNEPLECKCNESITIFQQTFNAKIQNNTIVFTQVSSVGLFLFSAKLKEVDGDNNLIQLIKIVPGERAVPLKNTRVYKYGKLEKLFSDEECERYAKIKKQYKTAEKQLVGNVNQFIAALKSLNMKDPNVKQLAQTALDFRKQAKAMQSPPIKHRRPDGIFISKAQDKQQQSSHDFVITVYETLLNNK